MDRKNPPRENPWQHARIKPATPGDSSRRPRETERKAPAEMPADAARSNEARSDEARSDVARHDVARPAAAQRRGEEVRIYGRNACLAVFARRSQDLRKVYLTEARIAEFKPVLAWCVKHRLGYRVVEADDLDRLTEAQHHEGVCFEVRRQIPLSVSHLLQTHAAHARPTLLVWLDGVGNPHNVGAILRSAANFGVDGLILPAGAHGLPGAALRVAEGGAEAVSLAQERAGEDVAALLRSAGFTLAATVPRDGAALYENPLPPRLAIALGAEGEGLSVELIRRADLRLTVPGTGAVESLNVSASAAVLFAEFWRQHCA